MSFLSAEDLLKELEAVAIPIPPIIQILSTELWLDYLSGNIKETCGGKTKTHRCLLCCPLCRRGSRCCLECHRCKYNDCFKHKTGRYGPGVKDIAGNYIIRPEGWEPLETKKPDLDFDLLYQNLFETKNFR